MFSVLPETYEDFKFKKMKYNLAYGTLEVDYMLTHQKHANDQREMDYIGISNTIDSPLIIHKDLKRCIDLLKLHFVFLVEGLDEDQWQMDLFRAAIQNKSLPEEVTSVLDRYKMTHVIVSGADEKETITLCGQRLMKRKKILNLVAPNVKIGSVQEGQYKFKSSLVADVNELIKEVELYLQGKCEWETGQLDLFHQRPIAVGG